MGKDRREGWGSLGGVAGRVPARGIGGRVTVSTHKTRL